MSDLDGVAPRVRGYRNPVVCIVGVLLLALLAGPAIAWLAHLAGVVRACRGGLGTSGVTGHWTGWQCRLDLGGAAVTLPLTTDIIIAVSLIVAVVGVLGALLSRRFGRIMALVPPIALTAAALPMGVRGWREGALTRYAQEPQVDVSRRSLTTEVGGDSNGWAMHMPTPDELVLQPPGQWLVVVFLACVVALVFLLVSEFRRI